MVSFDCDDGYESRDVEFPVLHALGCSSALVHKLAHMLAHSFHMLAHILVHLHHKCLVQA